MDERNCIKPPGAACMFRLFPLPLVLVAGLTFASLVPGAPPKAGKRGLDLSGYRTVDRAITTRISAAQPLAVPRAGYLGVSLEVKGGALVVVAVAADSPAEKAGLRAGDVLLRAGGKEVGTAEALGELVRAAGAEQDLKLEVERQGETFEATVKLAAL